MTFSTIVFLVREVPHINTFANNCYRERTQKWEPETNLWTNNKAIENLFLAMLWNLYYILSLFLCLNSIKSGIIKSIRIRDRIFYILSAVNSAIKMILLLLFFFFSLLPFLLLYSVTSERNKMLSYPGWKKRFKHKAAKEFNSFSSVIKTLFRLKVAWKSENVNRSEEWTISKPSGIARFRGFFSLSHDALKQREWMLFSVSFYNHREKNFISVIIHES